MMEERFAEGESAAPEKPEEARRPGAAFRLDRMAAGLLLIAMGGFLLRGTLLEEIDLRALILTWWPLVLIAAGLIKILQAVTGSESKGSGLGLIIFAALLLAAVALVPWEEIDLEGAPLLTRVRTSTQRVPLASGEPLRVEAEGCALRISRGDEPDVEIELRKRTLAWKIGKLYSPSGSSAISVERAEGGVLVRVLSEPAGDADRHLPLAAHLLIPEQAGPITVLLSNGSLSVSGLASSVGIIARDAGVEVSSISGEVTVSVDGGRRLALEKLDAGVSIAGGAAQVEMEEISGLLNVSIEKGSIFLENSKPIGSGIDLRLEEGDIELRLDEHSDIYIDAESGTGEIRCLFGGVEETATGVFRRSYNRGTHNLKLKTVRGLILIEPH